VAYKKMSKLIAIIDYRAGNIKSVENALKICGAKPIIWNYPSRSRGF